MRKVDRILVIDYMDGGQFIIDMEHLAAVSYEESKDKLEFYFTFRSEPTSYNGVNKKVAESIQREFRKYKNYIGALHTAPLKEHDDIGKLEHI